MKNMITEIKNTVEGNISRTIEAEEWISDLEDKMVEITTKEQNKGKNLRGKPDSHGGWEILLNHKLGVEPSV